ncbi:MAG: tetratricopeptide repeat protein [Candidatus Heimdallarchaeota archaeon]
MESSDEVKKLIQTGLANLKKNRLDEALKNFNQALNKDPNNTMAWNNKGVVLRKQGKIDEALDCYNKALALDPELTRAMLNKARALKVQKKFDLALFSYEEILEIDSEHPIAIVESERVRILLSKRAQLASVDKQSKDKEVEENALLDEKKEELIEFLEESRLSIADSVEGITEMFTHGIKEEAIEQRDKIKQAIVSFNDQMLNRIELMADEFITLDFEEECREMIDAWDDFKNTKIEELQKLV